MFSEGLVRAMNLTPYPARLIVPGEEPAEGSYLFAAVGNNHYAGGGFDVAPRAQIDDGLLDLTAIRLDRGVKLTSIKGEPAVTVPDSLYVKSAAEYDYDPRAQLAKLSGR